MVHSQDNTAPVPTHAEIVQFVIDAGNGRLQHVTTFLDKYPRHIDHQDDCGDTAVTWAIIRSEEKMVEFLLSRGADVNAYAKYGNTALFHAIDHRSMGLIHLLIAHGADVNAKNDTNITPLMHAAGGGHAEVVMLLLEKGADPAVENYSRQTASMIAEKQYPAIAAAIGGWIAACAAKKAAAETEARAQVTEADRRAALRNKRTGGNPFRKGGP